MFPWEKPYLAWVTLSCIEKKKNKPKKLEVEEVEESGKEGRKEKEERQRGRLPISIHPTSRPVCPVW